VEFDDFRNDCINSICNRHTFINFHCEKDSKINKCYVKYNRQLEKLQEKKKQQMIIMQEKLQEKREQQIIVTQEKAQDIRDIYKSEFEDRKNKYLAGEIDDLYGFKDNIDFEWERVKKIVNERDQDCVVWNHLLIKEQRLIVIRDHWENYSILHGIYDHAHIESIARRPDLKYDPDNVVLMLRFFHSRFDNMRCLITNKSINNEERQEYVYKFKEYIKSLKNL
jgi:hypothetical protein